MCKDARPQGMTFIHPSTPAAIMMRHFIRLGAEDDIARFYWTSGLRHYYVPFFSGKIVSPSHGQSATHTDRCHRISASFNASAAADHAADHAADNAADRAVCAAIHPAASSSVSMRIKRKRVGVSSGGFRPSRMCLTRAIASSRVSYSDIQALW